MILDPTDFNFDDKLNLYDRRSTNVLYNTDDGDKLFIGNISKAKASRRISEEFAEIIGGGGIKPSEVDDLLREIIAGDGIADKTGEIDLVAIGSDFFTLSIDNGTVADTITFTGSAVVDAIASLDKGFVNIPDTKNQFGIFNFDSSNSNTERFFLGGSANDKSLVSAEFDSLVGGTTLSEQDIPGIYAAITGSDGGDGKIDNVEVLANSGSGSFTLALNIPSRGTTDILIVNDNATVV